MFDNQAASPEKIVKLPDSGALRLAIGPQYYPWRWQLNGAIEAFAPLWLIAVFLGIVPAAWAFGAFDAKQSPPAEISPTEKKLP